MQKNAIIILVACVGLILIGAYLLYQPAKAPEAQNAMPAAATVEEVPFSVLATGTAAATPTTRKNIRITSTDELASVWTAVHGKKATPPKVDFSKDEVYAVYDGAHQTTGYSVSVSKIVETNGTRVVSIVHAAPDASCAPKKAATSPFQFVTVPVSGAALTHTDENATVSCK